MLRKKRWLALVAAALAGMGGSAPLGGSLRAEPPNPVAPIDGPVVQFVDNHQQPAHCRCGVNGGGAAYFLRPYVNNNTAFTTTTGGATVSEDFDWNYHVAPAAWLGWSSQCGVGMRARYFQFDQNSEGVSGALDAAGAATGSITPPAGLSPGVGVPPRGFQSPGVLLAGGQGVDALTANSDLKIQTLDGEATYGHEWDCCGLQITVGGRYMESRQNYHASLTNIPVAGTSETSFLDAASRFHGGGPLVSLFGRWEFGRSGLSIFGLARGSVMIGTLQTSAVFSETIADPATGGGTAGATSESRDDITIPIGELEAGLEYSRALGRTRMFFRGGAVNQTYFDMGSSSSRDGNLSLFGAQVSIGLNY